MPAFSIIGELLMKTASFETDTGRAAKSLQRLQKEAKATQAAFKGSFAGNLVSDIAQQLGATIAKLPGQVLNGLDALNDLSDATGATVENLSALEHVAKLNGGTLEDVGGILVKFNAALKNADGTDAISLALKQIGLDAKALKEIDPAEALRQTARALATFADDGNKARLVQELFGKSIKEAGPFLKDLAEQGQLNATVTTEQAKAAETLNKQFFALQTAVSDAARALASDWIPKITELLKLYTDGKETGESFWAAIFGQTQQGKLTGTAETLSQDLNRATDAIARMQEEFNRGGSTDSRLALRIEKAKERAFELQKQITATTAALGQLAQSRSPYFDPANYSNEGRNAKAPSVGALAKAPPKAAAAKKPTEYDAHVKAFIEDEKRLADALGDAQHAYESFYQQQQKTLEGFKDDAASARELADTFGFTQEELAKLNVEKLRSAAASLELLAINKGEKEGNEDLARLYREQAKAIRARAGAEEELIQKQRLLDTDPLTGASKAVKDYLDNISKAGLATYDVVTGALHSLEDITVEALQGGNIKSAAKNLVNQIIAEFYRLQIVRPLLNSIFSSGGWLEGILRLFNGGTFAGGNTTQSGSTGGFDFSGTGFPLASGTNYVPYDGFKASLHEGEAVIPKAYNPASRGVNIKVENAPADHSIQARQESDGTIVLAMQRIARQEISRAARPGGMTRQGLRQAPPDRN